MRGLRPRHRERVFERRIPSECMYHPIGTAGKHDLLLTRGQCSTGTLVSLETDAKS